mgnify:CR=1 FL=1
MPMATGPNDRLRIIVFGAHPDDCEHRVGGTAALWARMGHMVKFVSLTNGDAGHHSEGGGPLAARRRAESAEAARRLGIAESIVLDTHDGELLPVLERRHRVIREIRKWNAGLVLAHRTTDYHPDPRYTGVLVQDAACRTSAPTRRRCAGTRFSCITKTAFGGPYPFVRMSQWTSRTRSS